ncbi:class III lanthipeptide [Brevibacillus porteri]
MMNQVLNLQKLPQKEASEVAARWSLYSNVCHWPFG